MNCETEDEIEVVPLEVFRRWLGGGYSKDYMDRFIECIQ